MSKLNVHTLVCHYGTTGMIRSQVPSIHTYGTSSYSGFAGCVVLCVPNKMLKCKCCGLSDACSAQLMLAIGSTALLQIGIFAVGVAFGSGDSFSERKSEELNHQSHFSSDGFDLRIFTAASALDDPIEELSRFVFRLRSLIGTLLLSLTTCHAHPLPFLSRSLYHELLQQVSRW
jgi:hypothetical protein